MRTGVEFRILMVEALGSQLPLHAVEFWILIVACL